jgi:beta-glucosidase-like glycosyl hydrolase
VNVASLLVPALRWDAAHGFGYLRDFIDEALELGVGGFLIFGGTQDSVRSLTAELHERSRVPLLLASDVERGAGQQFEGCIGLPPFAALGETRDSDVLRRAARITARELKQLGLNWALAPVCDLDVAPFSPIVSTRALGNNATEMGEFLMEWVDACQAEGVLACAKHFPGHGRADGDSHVTLPVVRAAAEQLWHDDLLPFRYVIDAGIASMMTAHVSYPALDRSGVAATLSRPLLTELLRTEMGFDGLIVSDALEMDGVLAGGAEADVAVRAIDAGCDVLLAPMDISGTARALERAIAQGTLGGERVRDAIDRRDRWAGWARPTVGRDVTLDDAMWARQLADRSVFVVRGTAPVIGDAVEIIQIDDDEGGPWRVPSREHFVSALRAFDVAAPVIEEPSAHTKVPVIIAVYADVVAWKGRAGISDPSLARIDRAIGLAAQQKRYACVLLFSHPRHAALISDVRNVLCAWGGEPPMQSAAARVLARGLTAVS